jgi:hypothetical protein
MKLPTYSERHDTSLPTVRPQLRSAPALEQAALRRVSGVMPTDYSGIARAKAAKWGSITKAVTSIGEAYADAAYKTDMQNAKAAATELSVALNDNWYTTNVIEGKMYDPETDTFPYIGLEEKLKTDSEVITERILGKYKLRHNDAKSYFANYRTSIEGGLNKDVRKYMADKETERGRDADKNRLFMARSPQEFRDITESALGSGNWNPDEWNTLVLQKANTLNGEKHKQAIEQMSSPELLASYRRSVLGDRTLTGDMRTSVLNDINKQAEYLLTQSIKETMLLNPTHSRIGKIRNEYDVSKFEAFGFSSERQMDLAKQQGLAFARALLNEKVAKENFSRLQANVADEKRRLSNASLAVTHGGTFNVELADDINREVIRLERLTLEQFNEQHGYNVKNEHEKDKIIKFLRADWQKTMADDLAGKNERQRIMLDTSLLQEKSLFGTVTEQTTWDKLTEHVSTLRDKELDVLGLETEKQRQELITKFVVQQGREIELFNRAKAERDGISKDQYEKDKKAKYGEFLKQFNKKYGTTPTYANILEFQGALGEIPAEEMNLTELEKGEMMSWLLGNRSAVASRVERDLAAKKDAAELAELRERMNQGLITPADRSHLNDMFMSGVTNSENPIDINTPDGFMEAAELARQFKNKYQQHFPSLMTSRITAMVYGDMNAPDAIDKVALAVEAYRRIDSLKAPEGLKGFASLIMGNQGLSAQEIAAWKKENDDMNPRWKSDAKTIWETGNKKVNDDLISQFSDIVKVKWGLDLEKTDMVGKEVLTTFLGREFQKYYKGSEGAALHAVADTLMKQYGFQVSGEGEHVIEFNSPYARYTHLGSPGAGNAWIDDYVRQNLKGVAEKGHGDFQRNEVALIYQGDNGSGHPEYYMQVIATSEFVQKEPGHPYVISFEDAKPSNKDRDMRVDSVRKGAQAWDALKDLAGSWTGINQNLAKAKTPADSTEDREQSFANAMKNWDILVERYQGMDEFESLDEFGQAAALQRLKESEGHFIAFLEARGFIATHGLVH